VTGAGDKGVATGEKNLLARPAENVKLSGTLSTERGDIEEGKSGKPENVSMLGPTDLRKNGEKPILDASPRSQLKGTSLSTYRD